MRISQKHCGDRRRHAALAIGIASAVLAVAACAPGAKSTSAGASPTAATTAIGTAPATLNILVSTPDVPLFDALGKAFEAKYHNVTVKVSSEDFTTLITNTPHILSGGGAPDLVRIASFGNLVT